jgi:hypothetical protein
MKIDEIDDVLKEDTKYCDCILINGRWGIGKTYIIKNNKKNMNMSIISLFGKNNLEEIKEEIYRKTRGVWIYIFFVILLILYSLIESIPIKIQQVTPYEAIERIKDGYFSWATATYYFLKIFAFVGALLFGYFITKENFSKVFIKIKKPKREINVILESINIKIENREKILVLDDFERLSESIKIREILGFIEELKNLGYKIIIICDETKINNNYYKDFKEKIIDKVYNVESSDLEVAKNLLLQDIELQDPKEISDFIKSNNIVNLRTIIRCNKFIISILDKIKINQEVDRIKIIKTCLSMHAEYNDSIYVNKVKEEYRELESKIKNEKEKKYSTERIDLHVKFANAKMNMENILNRIYNYYNLDDIEMLELLNKIFLMINKEQNIDSLAKYLKKISTSDSLYTLENEYFDLEDDAIIEHMNEILMNLENNKYEISIYPKIIILFIKVKNMGFNAIHLKKCIEYMKINIQKSSQHDITFNDHIIDYESQQIVEEYNELTQDLKIIKKGIENSNKKNTINSIILKKDGWAMNLFDYYNNNETKFINDKQFMKLLDIDNLSDVIRTSKTKDIRDFGKILNSVYNHDIIHFSEDKESLEKLLQNLDNIIIDNNISKKYSNDFLITTLKEIIKRLG